MAAEKRHRFLMTIRIIEEHIFARHIRDGSAHAVNIRQPVINVICMLGEYRNLSKYMTINFGLRLPVSDFIGEKKIMERGSNSDVFIRMFLLNVVMPFLINI